MASSFDDPVFLRHGVSATEALGAVLRLVHPSTRLPVLMILAAEVALDTEVDEQRLLALLSQVYRDIEAQRSGGDRN
ncbi:MAG: hypothetical protein QN142_00880 [Armatimonadota bacterium]|nr:hypothetical protein [Armatimonadota bacterium]